MNERVSDDMLMAFVDGELDAAAAENLRRAVANDAALASRAEQFRMTRDAVRNAYAEVIAQPVSEALVASVLRRGGPSNVVLLSSRGMAQAALPLAASIALLFGVGGYWYGQQTQPGADPTGALAMAEAVGATASGEHRTIRLGAEDADFTTLATYEVVGGLCRTFEVSGADLQALRGVGCNRGADWRVELTVAQAVTGDNGYAPASGAALGSIDAFLDALEAQPVAEEEESGL